MATSTNARKRATTATAATPEAPPRRKRKPSKLKRLLRTLLLVLIVIAASVGATLYYTWPAGAELLNLIYPQATDEEAVEVESPVAAEKPAPTAPAKKPIFSKLEPFTVTINDGGLRSRIMHVAITLQVGDEESAVLLHEYTPVVRDRVLKILSEQHPAHVQTPDGREQLVDSLSNALSSPYGNGSISPRIEDLLFTAFVIQ